jgi:hypothetical protein
VRTLLISDLHLGSSYGADVLRRRAVRERLFGALDGVDRVVLLGDVLELRHGPPHDALDAAEPFFCELGDALAGRELVLVAGNHDHALVEPWLAARAQLGGAEPLGLETLLEPAAVSLAYERIATWAAGAQVQVAYPGLQGREDVYATHGHYLDLHMTVPTLERLGMGVMGRVTGLAQHELASVGDYEAVAGPVYAWRDSVARSRPTSEALSGITTVKAWEALGGGPRSGVRTLGAVAIRAGFPALVGALNRAGLGPLDTDLSPRGLRVAGLRAMSAAAANLGVHSGYLIFGHTHRPGPLDDDAVLEWLGEGELRLVNTGSWCYSAVFLTGEPGVSPYWPGSAVLVEDEGAPRLLRLLQDVGQAELTAPPG